MTLSGSLKLGTLELPWVDCEIHHRNALVSHEFPDVPGATVESTGRGPYTISASATLTDDWATTLDALVYAVDVQQDGDLTLADGRVIHVAVFEMVERWRQVDGVAVTLELWEDAEADAYTVPTAPELARTAPEFAAARGWTTAASALSDLRDLVDSVIPPTLGEMVAQYGLVASALVAVSEAALELQDRAGSEDAMFAVTLQWAALGLLPTDAREALDAAG